MEWKFTYNPEKAYFCLYVIFFAIFFLSDLLTCKDAREITQSLLLKIHI